MEAVILFLGDFFETWIGNDALTHTQRHVQVQLKRYAAQGLVIFIMPGNRDFLIDSKFCEQAQATYLPDPTLVHFGEHSCLLMHGDTLCTDDVAYQRYRKVIQQKWLQKLFLTLPITWRELIAQRIRKASRDSKKPYVSVDVTSSAVQKTYAQYGVTHLIYGHVHRQQHHIDGKNQYRFVLGDWKSHEGNFLTFDGHRFELKTFSLKR
ncbi:MAG: UDP-2,3-diacylglucosamine diphosphatase [Gammaproteobacteria bacterium]|nr:UDP-2,3-diacylglucosamine diphosphatase [Gammaproteobacteria bacterium]